MSTPHPPRRPTAGYSLVELLTVLTVLGVLVALAAPSLSGFLAQQRSRRALDRVATDIAYARLQAVRSGGPTVLRAGEDGRYSVEEVSAAGDTLTLRTVDLRAEFHGASFANPSLRLHFSSRGLLTNSTMEPITIVMPEGRDSLFVSPAGRVYRAY